MCGISFYCVKDRHERTALQQSLEIMKHRGPDARGSDFHELGNFSVGMGHNRLSIIDLSREADQPMSMPNGNEIIFNGEIYNFKKLRSKLERKKYEFRTNSDTEVILKLFENSGPDAFSSLRGMFAFVLIDRVNSQIYIVRDQLGVKPVYIARSDRGIYCCSEIRGLSQYESVDFTIDQDDVFEFFNHGFLYEPNTGYRNIHKLLPGHYLRLDLETGEEEYTAYSTLFDKLKPESNVESLISDSISRQCNSDVPVGVYFSGGMDSSLIACKSTVQQLLYARYESSEGSDSDLKYSRGIADYLRKDLVVAPLNESNSDPDELMATVDFVAANSEELISDFTLWPTYEIAKLARANGFTVMLSGMGGDEVFAGYPRYKVVKFRRLVRVIRPLLRFMAKHRLYPDRMSKRFDRLVSFACEKDFPLAYSRLLGYFSEDELGALFEDYDQKKNKLRGRLSRISGQTTRDPVKHAQKLDLHGFLSHNLTITDKGSMLASIEVRVPLLDESVVAKGLELDSSQLLKGSEPKYPIKKMLSKCLPSKFVDRPKTGFNPPLDGIIQKLGPERIREELRHTGKFIATKVVVQVVEDHFKGRKNNTYKIWQLLYFSRWLQLRGVD